MYAWERSARDRLGARFIRTPPKADVSLRRTDVSPCFARGPALLATVTSRLGHPTHQICTFSRAVALRAQLFTIHARPRYHRHRSAYRPSPRRSTNVSLSPVARLAQKPTPVIHQAVRIHRRLGNSPSPRQCLLRHNPPRALRAAADAPHSFFPPNALPARHQRPAQLQP